MVAFNIVKLQSQEDWLKERLFGIGASESPALFGVNPFESEFSLWARKQGKVPMSLEESEAMEWGKRLEDPIAQAYAEKTGRRVFDPGRNTILRSFEQPWLIATLDREISASDKDGPGVLEVKTAGEFRREDWEDGEIPLAYQVQVQHQLAVTGYKWGSIAVLIGGNKFGWKDVQRNDAFIEELRARCAAFWRRVESGEAPDVDGSERTAAALKALYAPNGSMIELGPEVQEYDDELVALKAHIKALEERADLLKNKVRAALGDASVGVLPCGAKYSVSTTERAGYTVAPATVTTMRRLQSDAEKKAKKAAKSAA